MININKMHLFDKKFNNYGMPIGILYKENNITTQHNNLENNDIIPIIDENTNDYLLKNVSTNKKTNKNRKTKKTNYH